MGMEQNNVQVGTTQGGPKVMTSAEVSRYLGVSLNTLQKWRTRNTGPRYMKYGDAKSATIRYDAEDVEKFRLAHTVPTTYGE